MVRKGAQAHVLIATTLEVSVLTDNLDEIVGLYDFLDKLVIKPQGRSPV